MMEDYSFKISDSRKAELQIKPTTTRPKTGNREELQQSALGSRGEKRNTTSRRQQRHSTEIGSEYYRWWAVRSSLGFQTNEHIAGLLLDGFHALLQHLVVTCGGEGYTGSGDGNPTGDSTKPSSYEAASPDCKPNMPSTYSASMSSSTSSSASSSSSSSSSSSLPQCRTFSSSFASPPGAEEAEGFSDFNNAIVHYTNTLWWMCAQPDSGLHKLKSASPILQEFILRLLGYIRGGRGLALSDRKRSTTSKDGPFAASSPTCEGPPPLPGRPFNLPPLSVNHGKVSDSKIPYVNITHPRYSHASVSVSLPLPLPPLAFSFPNPSSIPQMSLEMGRNDSNISLGYPASKESSQHHKSSRFISPVQATPQTSIQLAPLSMTNHMPDQPSSLKDLSSKDRRLDYKPIVSSFEKEPLNYLKDLPSNPAAKSEFGPFPAPGDHHPSSTDPQLWPSQQLASVPIHLFPSYTSRTSTKSNDGLTYSSPGNLKPDGLGFKGKANPIMNYNQFDVNGKDSISSLSSVYSGLHKDITKNLPYAPTQGTPLLFFPAPTPVVSNPTSLGNLLSGIPKPTSSSLAEKIPGNYLPNPAIVSNPRSHCLAFPSGDSTSSVSQQHRQRQESAPFATSAMACMPPLPALPARMPAISQSSLIPLFYSHTMSLPLRIQPPIASVAWTNVTPSYPNLATRAAISSIQNTFNCNQNNTMWDNFSLFRMQQEASFGKSPSTSLPHFQPFALQNPADSRKMKMPLNSTEKSLLRVEDLSSSMDFKYPSASFHPYFDGRSENGSFMNTRSSEAMDYSLRSVTGAFYLLKSNIKSEDKSSMNSTCNLTFSTDSKLKTCQSEGNRSNVSLESSSLTYDKENADRRSPLFSQREGKNTEKEDREKKINDLCSTLFTPSLSTSKPCKENQSNILNLCLQTTSSDSNFSSKFSSNDSYKANQFSEKVTTTELSSLGNVIINSSPLTKPASSTSSPAMETTSSGSSSLACRNSRGAKPRKFVCSSCSLVFYSGTDLLVHRYEMHSHVCGECDRRFLALAKLKQHKASDHPQILVCPRCRFSSFSKDAMDDHLRSKHMPEVKREQSPISDKDERNSETVPDNDVDTSVPSNKSPEPIKMCNIGDKSCSVAAGKENLSHGQAAQRQSAGNGGKTSQTDCGIQTSCAPFHTKDNRERFVSDHSIPEQEKDTVSRPEIHSRTKDQRKLPSKETPCPGSVFPSFSRTAPRQMTSTRVDDIVSMFSQVNEYCHFDPLRLVSSGRDDAVDDTADKETGLCVHTDTDMKEMASESIRKRKADDQSINNCVLEKYRMGGEQQVGIDKQNDSDTPPMRSSRTKLNVSDSGDCDSVSVVIKPDKIHSRKRAFPVSRSYKKRKLNGAKPSKKVKSSNGCYDQITNNGQDQQISHPEANEDYCVEIHEKSSFNNSIGTHTVWLDDLYGGSEKSNFPKYVVDDQPEQSSVLKPICDPSHQQQSPWKMPSNSNTKKNYDNYKRQDRDVNSGHFGALGNDKEERYGSDEKEGGGVNSRILSLRERHRSYSLPPKKRGFKKSYRLHPDTKHNDIMNENVTSLVDGDKAVKSDD